MTDSEHYADDIAYSLPEDGDAPDSYKAVLALRDIATWLQRIAVQLAVMNERHRDTGQ